MTADDHRRIGSLLGFPPCCVEEWITDGNRAAVRRGSIAGHTRTPTEIAELIAAGVPPACIEPDTVKRWVPCTEHMYSPGWSPFLSPQLVTT